MGLQAVHRQSLLAAIDLQLEKFGLPGLCTEGAGKSPIRVSFETSFDSKQPKLEPKLVSALSETKRLFQLFRFYTETECFDVSIDPKQTEDQQKQFDREHSLLFFTENLGFFIFFFLFCFLHFFSFFPVFFGLFRLFCFYTETGEFRCSIEPKQTEDTPK
jgi:hypothetical protein